MSSFCSGARVAAELTGSGEKPGCGTPAGVTVVVEGRSNANALGLPGGGADWVGTDAERLGAAEGRGDGEAVPRVASRACSGFVLT